MKWTLEQRTQVLFFSTRKYVRYMFAQILLFSNVYNFVASYCADSYYFIYKFTFGSDTWNPYQYSMLPFSGTLLPL